MSNSIQRCFASLSRTKTQCPNKGLYAGYCGIHNPQKVARAKEDSRERARLLVAAQDARSRALAAQASLLHAIRLSYQHFTKNDVTISRGAVAAWLETETLALNAQHSYQQRKRAYTRRS